MSLDFAQFLVLRRAQKVHHEQDGIWVRHFFGQGRTCCLGCTMHSFQARIMATGHRCKHWTKYFHKQGLPLSIDPFLGLGRYAHLFLYGPSRGCPPAFDKRLSQFSFQSAQTKCFPEHLIQKPTQLPKKQQNHSSLLSGSKEALPSTYSPPW